MNCSHKKCEIDPINKLLFIVVFISYFLLASQAFGQRVRPDSDLVLIGTTRKTVTSYKWTGSNYTSTVRYQAIRDAVTGDNVPVRVSTNTTSSLSNASLDAATINAARTTTGRQSFTIKRGERP